MKKVAFILLFSVFSFFSMAWSQEEKCPAPMPYVSASGSTSCTLAWNSVAEANYYIIEVYEVGSSNIVQTLQTDETFITINNLNPNHNYEAVVYSVCDNGKSPSSSTALMVIVEDVIMFLERLEPGTFKKTNCKTHLKETCMTKSNPRMSDLMQYGGNIFRVQTRAGHFLEWQCRFENNELVFRNSTNNTNISLEPIVISTRSNPNMIIGLAFKDARTRTLLGRLMETRNPNGQVSFDLIFETDACLTVQSCETTIVYPPRACQQIPELCTPNKEGSIQFLTPKQNNTLFVVPNPVLDEATVLLDITETEDVSINIYDVTGKQVTSLHKGLLERGNHEFKWQSSSLLRGMYFVKVKTATQEFVQKFIKL